MKKEQPDNLLLYLNSDTTLKDPTTYTWHPYHATSNRAYKKHYTFIMQYHTQYILQSLTTLPETFTVLTRLRPISPR